MVALSHLVGQTFDEKYRLERLLGQGGMGAVFLATHLGTDRPVALKVISPDLMANREAFERFRREARAAGRLRHPNVVNVTDFGIARLAPDSVAYLVMEYLDGSTLGELLSTEGTLPLQLTVDIVEQVALAVDQAHRQGVIHRDLKPDNIWLQPDSRGGYLVKVLDFGIAKLREETMPVSLPDLVSVAYPQDGVTLTPADMAAGDMESATLLRPSLAAHSEVTPPLPSRSAASGDGLLTRAGAMIGTPAYMSPEQCRGEALDARSDVYSLGVVAYQMLSGERPFSGNTLALIRKHTEESAPDLWDKRRDLPKSVGQVVMSALAKNANERPMSAMALAGSLRARSEGVTFVLRRAIALYSEHFPSFFRISLITSYPLVPLAILVIAAIPFGWTLEVAGFVAVVTWTMMTMMSHASFAIVIDQLRSAPLRPVNPRGVFIELGKRLGVESPGGVRGLWRTFLAVLKLYFQCERKAPPGKGDLAFLAALIEGLEAGAAATRSKLLAVQLPRTFDLVRGTLLLFFLGIEGVVFLLATGTVLAFKDHVTIPIWYSGFLAFAALPLSCLWINPVFSTSFALLYFRARQAGGEDVRISAVFPTSV